MAHATIKETSSPDRTLVVTTADLREFLRVDTTADDDLIEALREVACSWVEDHCNTKLPQVDYYAYLDSFYAYRLPVGPVTITAVDYKATNYSGTWSSLASAKYFVDTDSTKARIKFDNPPDLHDEEYHRVRITGKFGYKPVDIPGPLKQAVRILVSHFYDNRTAVTIGATPREVPFTVLALCNPHRVE